MSQDAPSISAEAVQQLLTTAQDASALAQAPAGLWPVLLQKRLGWLSQWDTVLEPVFVVGEGINASFPLKPQQVSDLLRAWAHGLPERLSQSPPNSAALMLMGFSGSSHLVEAAQHWAESLVAAASAENSHTQIDRGLALVRWFRRWGRQAAEQVLLEALQAVAALAPQDQERLLQLGGERWKGQRMHVSSDRPRIALRDRADAHSLERYFKDRPEAAQTLLALRSKPVNATNERLLVQQWSADGFFAALAHHSRAHSVLAGDYEMHRMTIVLAGAHGDEMCGAALYRSTRNALALLLTITEKGGIADIRLSTLVAANDMTLDAYCKRTMQMHDDGESPIENIARGAVVDAVQAALQSIRVTHRPNPGSLAG